MPKAWKLVLYEKRIKVFTSLFGNADRNFTLEAGRPGFAHLRSLSALRKPTRIGKASNKSSNTENLPHRTDRALASYWKYF